MARLRPFSMIREILVSGPAGGVILVVAAVSGLIAANSGWNTGYQALIHRPLFGHDVLYGINDGLMALFFLLVGLEVKREWVDGELSSRRRRLLPGVAAVAGMVVPALVFVALNRGDPAALRGWAVPAATDIAFALAVLALLGRRVPPSLKILLTAIAIIDDLGAILIIAVFYTASLDWTALAAAAGGVALLALINRRGVQALWPYLLIGAGIWYAVLLSGVHATLAGVAVAFTVPLRRTPGAPAAADSPLHRLEHALQPLVSFVVVPLFGFANAGVDLRGLTLAQAVSPLPLGVALGLVLGKTAGIYLAIRGLAVAGWSRRPSGATWRQVLGLAMLCGIGFTMSLFIAGLAFGDGTQHDEAKLGILAGSLISAIAGWLVLATARKEPA